MSSSNRSNADKGHGDEAAVAQLNEFVLGDLIWVRLCGSSWWPAQVVDDNTSRVQDHPVLVCNFILWCNTGLCRKGASHLGAGCKSTLCWDMSSTNSGTKSLTCFCYWGGERKITNSGTFNYAGGVSEPVIAHDNISYDELLHIVCSCLQITLNDKVLYYNTKRDKTKYLRLKDQQGVTMLFYLNEDEVDIFVEETVRRNIDLNFISSRFVSQVWGSNLEVDTLPPSRGVTPSHSQSHVNSSNNNEMGIIPYSEERANELLTGEGQYFDNPEHFKQAITVYSAINKFSYKYLDNSRAYYRIVCTVDGCRWKLTARCEGKSDIVRVIRFRKQHTHTAQDVCNYQPRFRTGHLGSLFKDKVMDKPTYLARDICREFEEAYSIRLSYMQGWRAKEHAKACIRGPPSMTYNLIPWMCERLIQSIPNTRAFWTRTEESKFKQLFVAYGCSITGFMAGCRPLLFIDACDLTGPYQGHLLSATAHDADDNLYPLAYAVVSSENDDDWLWFAQNLKEIICQHQVVFITNRKPSLLKAMTDVFGSDCNAWCLRDLKENFSKFASSKMIKGSKKQTTLRVLDQIAYARTEQLYRLHLTKLTAIDKDLGKWVEESAPRQWANAFFPYKRWDKMYINLAECFNSWILPERDLDIFQLMKGHVDRTTEMLLRKQTEVQSWKLPVGPNIEKMIKLCQDQSNGFTHRATSTFEFAVTDCDHKTFAVKLNPSYCSCLEWQMTGIPCPHACRAIHGAGLSVYDAVDPMLTRQTQLVIYASIMSPVPLNDIPSSVAPIVAVQGTNDSASTTSTLSMALFPPTTKRPPGRPKKKRMESQSLEKNTVYCGRCWEPGHNRATCKSPLPVLPHCPSPSFSLSLITLSSPLQCQNLSKKMYNGQSLWIWLESFSNLSPKAASSFRASIDCQWRRELIKINVT
ncbi:hypothetical protein HYC85_020333 [Camellia sinensis]|uniref:SWIM-type domain-containing protein n=1 Tax=Camellia sinensis TaxID=4442 RepID=A0A7J7GRX9_CAMSI|nr:hypothetical protein HYC85_020333 [Camellia sinensis]